MYIILSTIFKTKYFYRKMSEVTTIIYESQNTTPENINNISSIKNSINECDNLRNSNLDDNIREYNPID